MATRVEAQVSGYGGIDVGKLTLPVAAFPQTEGRTLPNTADRRREPIAWRRPLNLTQLAVQCDRRRHGVCEHLLGRELKPKAALYAVARRLVVLNADGAGGTVL